MSTENETPREYTKQERALIDRYRDWNVDHNWWEGVYEQVKEELKEIGFEPGAMYFSGFWSQGDGACFEGIMSDWAKFCEKVPAFVQDFPFLSEYLKDQGGSYSVTHRGSYYHANCTEHEYSSELDYDLGNIHEATDDPAEQMRRALWEKALAEEGSTYDTRYGSLTDWLSGFFKDKMRDLYRRLEKEHDYLTSDDVVWEAIEANELDKQEMIEDEEDEDAVDYTDDC